MHPLDPLSAEELSQVVVNARKVWDLKEHHLFAMVQLNEPNKELLNNNTSNLQTSLSTGIVLQSRDKDGNLITRESRGNRTTLEKQLDKNSKQEDKISSKLDIINDSIFIG